VVLQIISLWQPNHLISELLSTSHLIHKNSCRHWFHVGRPNQFGNSWSSACRSHWEHTGLHLHIQSKARISGSMQTKLQY